MLVSTLAATTFAATESYIVTLHPGTDAKKVAKEFKVKPKHVYRHALSGFAVTLDDDKVKKLKKDKRVLAVEPDGYVELLEQTNSTGILRMGLTNFPLARINGVDERLAVDVAVLDTGIESHSDLNVVQSVSFTDAWTGHDPAGARGHGTEMAGIIGALDNNYGVVGIAPGVRLWSVQVIGPTVRNWAAHLAGLDYVAQNAGTISVLNVSLAGSSGIIPREAMNEAYSRIVNQGVVIVAGSGNDANDIAGSDLTYGTSDDVLPAALSAVMTVSGMYPMADRIWENSNASFSNKHPRYVISPGFGLDVTAPAVNIVTTAVGTNYALVTGTSAATAHVSGLVALYIAANGRATNAESVYRIRQAIVDSALPQSQWQPNPLIPSGCPDDPGTRDPDCNREPLAIPSESWIPHPLIISQGATPGGFEFSFTTVPGYRYIPQHTGSLTASNQWTDLAATNGTGVPVTVSDPVLNAIRYYRVKRERTP